MTELKITTQTEFEEKLEAYPDFVRDKIKYLRNLVRETANETEEIDALEETLKWGEPSFLTKTGSTLRMDWKEKTPDQYALYFKCTSKLVPSFKTVFKDRFKVEGSRAIVFNLNDPIPENELKQCIRTTLLYHKVKDKMLLGL